MYYILYEAMSLADYFEKAVHMSVYDDVFRTYEDADDKKIELLDLGYSWVIIVEEVKKNV